MLQPFDGERYWEIKKAIYTKTSFRTIGRKMITTFVITLHNKNLIKNKYVLIREFITG